MKCVAVVRIHTHGINAKTGPQYKGCAITIPMNIVKLLQLKKGDFIEIDIKKIKGVDD